MDKTRRSRCSCRRAALSSTSSTMFFLCLSFESYFFNFVFASLSQNGKRPLDFADEGSSTHALLTEMELVGADEQVLVKSAAKRFRPAATNE